MYMLKKKKKKKLEIWLMIMMRTLEYFPIVLHSKTEQNKHHAGL